MTIDCTCPVCVAYTLGREHGAEDARQHIEALCAEVEELQRYAPCNGVQSLYAEHRRLVGIMFAEPENWDHDAMADLAAVRMKLDEVEAESGRGWMANALHKALEDAENAAGALGFIVAMEALRQRIGEAEWDEWERRDDAQQAEMRRRMDEDLKREQEQAQYADDDSAIDRL